MGVTSCKGPLAPYPIKISKEDNVNVSVIRNKSIYGHELQLIQNSIEAEVTLDFRSFEKGFWYAFIDRQPRENQKIESGDIINFKIET
ncbi:MAG: hypothetical protein OXC92_01155 [Flavobacteriaceae bacterium]|nr:hypothetical protein [Flavobacteriaceae bacterium]MCY4253358.1 hypothetical protein [Flavobacteriaceae bacterium]